MNIGKVYETKFCGDLVVTGYEGNASVGVTFVKTGYKTVTSARHIRDGSVKDYYHKSILGVACIGDTVTILNGNRKRSYICWNNMLSRCYKKDNAFYKNYGGRGVTVCEEWLTYSAFENWYNDNYIDGFEVDKDISSNSRSLYSPEFCRFVSQTENKREMVLRSKVKNFCVEKDGVVYSGLNRSEFARNNNLNIGNFNAMIKGDNKSCKGFTLHSKLLEAE